VVVNGLPQRCVCCGGEDFTQVKVLWPELVAAWELSPEEATAVELQQGLLCTTCRCSMRSMVLARAIVRAFGGSEPFSTFVGATPAQRLRVLEINEAGNLTQFLTRLPRHLLVNFPEFDMMALPFEDGAFDLVCHSDTLEHVTEPVRALRECARILRPRGILAFTVPVVPGRPTRRRDALAPSYHAGPVANAPDRLVHTEYGYDLWRQVIDAGFDECRIVALAPPIAYAIVAVVPGP
jgi:SAM-dependent methyltransferase